MSVPPAAEPSQRHGPSAPHYRPDVDGLRAIAALSVVICHAGWLPGGGYGVDVFFVISGFLISGIILRELEKSTFSIANFYARRVKRIFPALIALLLVVGVLGSAILPATVHARLGKDIAAGASFLMNFWMYHNVSEVLKLSGITLAHLWTLGIEEQFYLVWPLTLWVAWKLKISLPTTIVGATCFSFIWFASTLSINHGAAWWLPWSRLWELALGGLLACIQTHRQCATTPTTDPWPKNVQASGILFPRSQRYLGMIGALCLFVSLGGLIPSGWSEGWYPLTSAVGSFLLIAAGSQGWINRNVLSLRPLVLIGLFSYPLYLWHAPLFVFGEILHFGDSPLGSVRGPVHVRIGVIALSIFFAYFTYQYLERPIRSSRHTNIVAQTLCAIMALIAGAAYLFLIRATGTTT